LYWKRLIPESNVHSAWIFQRERESNFSCPKTCQVFFGLFLKGVSSYDISLVSTGDHYLMPK
ncbi:MAG: hypothetical protein Q8L82_03790, partial [Nitrosomonas sp.]|nr:hypothetical protein [Nitrosomonas sp.]